MALVFNKRPKPDTRLAIGRAITRQRGRTKGMPPRAPDSPVTEPCIYTGSTSGGANGNDKSVTLSCSSELTPCLLGGGIGF